MFCTCLSLEFKFKFKYPVACLLLVSFSLVASYSFRCVSSSPSTLTLLSPIALTPTASG